ncbi:MULTISPECIES: TlpA disulfide reductase family protein [unclassified Undibacterium]|uniref:TlpA family protein disulfide reductase n=1 Tax=unclassified Undibacterium TaxID=2630295 RepID=UPI002AC8DFD7|nr:MULTISPECIES: TlpA disulfide reductase family protein [unclassified Undibacterium]MEB0137816.1 TlpA disulfide reductase family protein [Undibacterium sp. CCC2.1]MEB0170993.1 TlpA disulfide reductase family protein [Undibacterium sp. CCC1.1]MEB0175038.1 TlpA disulfide reductase family protein [Undibacterium sp. CCC3.4]MEB0215184.1 TlpA disulfide reductase family protein [Undibacterium sp. 5I2]WPX44844.1 TlpA disulfide reductase family protein [Undibacterium sp. CCC3.4]
MIKKSLLLSITLASLFSCAILSDARAAQSVAAPALKQQMSLSGTDANGKKIELADFAGKTVLVSFFTAGCNLCVRDLKLMREFYVGNAKRKFVLLAVNIDQNKQDFDTYLQLINLAIPKEQRFPLLWRGMAGHNDNFGTVISQPTHFVINPQGQLLLKREGSFRPEDWDNLWESLPS